MTIKRRLLAIIIALITIVSISGCGNTNLQSTYTNKIDAQVLISSTVIEDSRYKQFVVYDPDTLVMYTLTWDYISGNSTITALYNADGSLKVYDENSKTSAFVLLSSTAIEDSRYKQFVVYDSDTLVMYTLTMDYISGGSTITVLYNADKSFRTK